MRLALEITNEQLEYLGTREEFAEAIEQVCYSVDGKGVRVIGSENDQRGLPPHVQAISKASNNLLVGLRAPEVLGLFQDSKFEEWRYLSRDQVNIDAIAISIEGKHDHFLEPPERPLWRFGSHGIAVGYCVRIFMPISNEVLSVCLHATKLFTGPKQIVRRVEFRGFRRDAKNYSENRDRAYHPRSWKPQKVISAVGFNVGPTANGRTAVAADYYNIVEPFYRFITNELQQVLVKRNTSVTETREKTSISGSELRSLHSTLLQAFSEPEVTMLIRMELDENYAAIAEGQTFSERAFNLLQWAERRGRLGELVLAASREREGNEALIEYAEKYGSL